MNPLLLMKFGPYVLIFIAGFGIAFGIQELRLTSAEQEFTEYKQDQQRIIQQQIDQANMQRKKANDDYVQAQAALKKAIDSGEIYARCVRAGKCGVVRPAPACPGLSLPTAGEPDGIGGTPVPAASGPTTEVTCEGLASDAAKVQLKLNKLQDNIEAQPGY